MKEPKLSDIIGGLYDSVDDIEVEGTDFGDPENTNITTPIITTINAVVTYHVSPITRAPFAKVAWSWDEPKLYDEDGNIVDPEDPEIDDDIYLDPVTNYLFGTSIDGSASPLFSSTNGARSVVTGQHVLGTDITLSVCAVTKSGIRGPASSYTVSIIKDTTPPPTPSAPVGIAALKGAVFTFNGKDSLGSFMPNDFAYVALHVSTVSGFTPDSTNFVRNLTMNESAFVSANANYDVMYAKFVAYDTSYNASAASSAQTAVTPTRVISTDLNVVLPGNVAFSDVNNLLPDGSFEQVLLNNDRVNGTLKVGTWSSVTTPVFHGERAIRVNGDATSTKYLYLASNSYTNTQLFGIQVIPGSKLYLSYRLQGLASANGTVHLACEVVRQDNTVSSFLLTKSSAPTGAWEQLESVIQLPANAKYMAVRFLTSGHTTGQWYFDTVQVRQVIGTSLIEDAAITNAKIANLAVDDGKIASLAAGKITTGQLQASAEIKAGADLNAAYASLSGTGFRAYVYDPDADAVVEVIRLGTSTSDLLSIRDSSGKALAGISNTGEFVAKSGTFDDSLSVGGNDINDLLNQCAKGIISWIAKETNSASSSGTEVTYLEWRAVLLPNRLYKFVVAPHYIDASDSGSYALMRLRAAFDGAAVSTSSDELARSKRYAPTTISTPAPGVQRIFSTDGQATPTREVRLIYTIARDGGSGTVNVDGDPSFPVQAYIEDAGPSLPMADAIAKYTSVWNLSSSEAYDGSGVPRTDPTYAGYANNPLVQGPCLAGSMNWSQLLFNGNAISGQVGVSVDTALTDAQIDEVWLYLYAQHTGASSGVVAQVRPSTLTALNNTAPSGAYVTKTIKEGSGIWINITTQWKALSGARSIWLGPGLSATAAYHGHFRSEMASKLAQLKLVYRK